MFSRHYLTHYCWKIEKIRDTNKFAESVNSKGFIEKFTINGNGLFSMITNDNGDILATYYMSQIINDLKIPFDWEPTVNTICSSQKISGAFSYIYNRVGSERATYYSLSILDKFAGVSVSLPDNREFGEESSLWYLLSVLRFRDSPQYVEKSLYRLKNIFDQQLTSQKNILLVIIFDAIYNSPLQQDILNNIDHYFSAPQNMPQNKISSDEQLMEIIYFYLGDHYFTHEVSPKNIVRVR